MKKYISSILIVLISVAYLGAADYNVTVSANENSSALLSAIGFDHLDDVTVLKVTGTLNGYDYMAIRNKLPNLQELDLSGTTIKENENEYHYYQSLSVKSTEFPAYLFYSCGISDKLVSIKLPQNIETIGDYAFYMCTKLTSVTFNSNVKEINSYAFNNCSLLPSIQLPNSVETIGANSFQKCSKLKTINFPSVLYSIGGSAFYSCSTLENVEFTGDLNSIGDYAFKGCSNLVGLEFNSRLSSIGAGAFGNCNKLTQLTLPSSLTKIGGTAFDGCTQISTINAYAVQPIAIEQNTFSPTIFNSCVLNVPRAGYSAYFWDTKWSQFSRINQCDFSYENLYISYTGEDYLLNETTGTFQGNPEITVLPKAGIIIQDDIDQKSSEIILINDGENSGSVIATNNLTASLFTMQIDVKKDTWYYFCFPYEVQINMGGVRCRGNWVIRTYSGQQRASSGHGWTELRSGETTLKAGVGYIFQTDTNGPLFFTMNNPTFNDQDQSLRIELYNSTNEKDASWNFLGNPYPTYYCLKDLGYDSPITVRNLKSNTYIAYSGTDDTYHLAPFQPFFVQKPATTNLIRFQASKRRTYVMSQNQSYLSAPRSGGVESARKVIDLALLDKEGDMADRTRVVFNDSMSYGYDLGADAAKFFSNEATLELYTIVGTNAYSINERPQSGDVQVAFRATEAGTYSLSLMRADSDVELYDAYTGQLIDLTAGDYCFETEAGTIADRFVIAASCSVVEMIEKPENDFYYDLSGRRSASMTTPGAYIVNRGTIHSKMIVR